MNHDFELIWKNFHSKLRQFIFIRVNSRDDAEDILQEVFIRIYKKIDTLKDEQKLSAWIFQITRNTIIDYYRAKKESGEYEDERFKVEAEVEEEAVQKLTPSLMEMIKQLPQIYKEAVILTELEGLKQRELADKLGISLTAAKSRVQRARHQLKEMLLDCCNFEFDSAGKMCDFSKKMNCCENFTELRDTINDKPARI